MTNNKRIILSLLILTFSLLSLTTDSSAFAESEQEKNNPSLYNNYMEKGIFALERKNYEKGEYYFLKAIEISPNKADAYMNIAAIRIRKDDLQTAMELLYQAEEYLPENSSKTNILLYNLGLCTYLQGNYKNGIKYFSKIIDSNPSFAQAIYNRGLCYQNLGQKELALANIRKAKYLFVKQENLSFTRKADKTLAILEGRSYVSKDGITQSLVSANTLLEAGSRKFKTKKSSAAIGLIKESILSDPYNAEAHYRLGTIYARQGKYTRAIKSFKKTIKIDPNYTKAYTNLGIVYGKLRKYAQALSLFKKALKMDKNNPKIYYNIATTHLTRGDKKAAMKFFKKAKVLGEKSGNQRLVSQIDKFLSKK